MLLSEAFNKVLREYRNAFHESFVGHPLAAFLRKNLPELLRRVAEIPAECTIDGSAGQSQWARCPWVAVLDPLVTDSAQKGYYIVYLFKEDFSGLYLSLNQGVTDIQRVYRSDAKSALQAKATDFRARLPKDKGRISFETIDLAPSTPSNYSAYYEKGNIVAAFYSAAGLPGDSTLVEDLRQAMALYNHLSDTESVPVGTIGEEEDEQDNSYIEDYATFRQHKRIERNARLSAEVKRIHGYVCQACAFDFARAYPKIEKNKYIEAHHLIPIADLKGQRTKRDPRTDFAVLCANCHRMIHRFHSPWDLSSFRTTIKANES